MTHFNPACPTPTLRVTINLEHSKYQVSFPYQVTQGKELDYCLSYFTKCKKTFTEWHKKYQISKFYSDSCLNSWNHALIYQTSLIHGL